MEFCATRENRKKAHVPGSQNEMERIWRISERIWTFDQLEKEVPARTWDEMFFGGGGVFGVNWQANKVLTEKAEKRRRGC